MTRLTPLKSEGPRKPRRQTPPYWPISSAGTTRGFSGRRWATGGSLPAFTRSASTGASLYVTAGAAERATHANVASSRNTVFFMISPFDLSRVML